MIKEENIDYINSIHDSYIKELQKQDEYIEKLREQNKKYKEKIDKAIKLIEDSYHSKNTTDIDSIVVSGDKLLQVRKILKGVE